MPTEHVRIGIISNPGRDGGFEFAGKVAGWLRARGCELYAEREAALSLGLPELTDALYAGVDYLICLGGDGTILHAAHSARQKPLLGINLGRLGYLTDVGRDEAFIALDNLLAGSYLTERRMMLEAVVGEAVYPALNDVCVTRGALSRLIEIEIFINNEYIDTYRSDGVIVCTPTGSTAYNLSAGGPVLKPDADMFAITPICAHKIYSRSIVVSAADVVTLRVLSNYDCTFSPDGRYESSMGAGAEVIIRRSERYTTIIKTHKQSFFDILRRKMS